MSLRPRNIQRHIPQSICIKLSFFSHTTSAFIFGFPPILLCSHFSFLFFSFTTPPPFFFEPSASSAQFLVVSNGWVCGFDRYRHLPTSLCLCHFPSLFTNLHSLYLNEPLIMISNLLRIETIKHSVLARIARCSKMCGLLGMSSDSGTSAV